MITFLLTLLILLKIKLVAWNMGTMTDKRMTLAEDICKRNLDIACFQEKCRERIIRELRVVQPIILKCEK